MRTRPECGRMGKAVLSEGRGLPVVRKSPNIRLMQRHADLIAAVTDYLDATGMAPTRFGRLVNNDRSLVAALWAGRDIRLSTARRIADFIAANPPGHPNNDMPRIVPVQSPKRRRPNV